MLILEYVMSHKCLMFDRKKFSNFSVIIHKLENLEWTKVMTVLLAIVTDAQNAQNDLESNKLCNDSNHEEDSKNHSSSCVHDNEVDVNKDHICNTNTFLSINRHKFLSNIHVPLFRNKYNDWTTYPPSLYRTE